MESFVDPSARVESKQLGRGSRVLAYAQVGPDVVIAEDCVVSEHSVIVGRVHVEQGVVVGAGAIVGAGSSSAAGEEDREPTGAVHVRRFASIGPNATIVSGVVIGRRAVVEAGSVVTHSVPANAIVSGNPARIVSYVDAGEEASRRELTVLSSAGDEAIASRVRGVSVHRLTSARDLRGSLVASELSELPFQPRRLFAVYQVPNESVRGAHAHRTCAQFVICVAGAVSCLVDDGDTREEIRLSTPSLGLCIRPMVWGTQFRYTQDAVLLVLASHPYDPEDYIREYEEFLEAVTTA
jgi:acetyltransferase-like isoleucine patch superfamily enzyme